MSDMAQKSELELVNEDLDSLDQFNTDLMKLCIALNFKSKTLQDYGLDMLTKINETILDNNEFIHIGRV